MNRKGIIIGIVVIAFILSMSVLSVKLLHKKVSDNKEQKTKVELKNKDYVEPIIEENNTTSGNKTEGKTISYLYDFNYMMEKDKDFESFIDKHQDCLNTYCTKKEFNKVKNKKLDSTKLINIDEYKGKVVYTIDSNNNAEEKIIYVGSNDKYTSVVYVAEEKSKSYLIENATNKVIFYYEPEEDESIKVYDFYKDYIILYAVPFASQGEYVAEVYTSDLKELATGLTGFNNGVYFYGNDVYVFIDNKLTVYNSSGEKKYNINKKVLGFNKDYIAYYEGGYVYISDYKISKNTAVGKIIKDLTKLASVSFYNNKLIIEEEDPSIEKTKELFDDYCEADYEFEDYDDDYSFGYLYKYDINKGLLEKTTTCLMGQY